MTEQPRALGAMHSGGHLEERSTIKRTPTVIRNTDTLNFDCQTTTATTNPARAASGSRSAIPPALPCSGSAVRSGIDEP
jgi:hypothetical protein